MENFFGKMKNEMFYGFENTFKSLEELKQAMVDYIEYYNNSRITVKEKDLTPVQIRNQALHLIYFCPTKSVHYIQMHFLFILFFFYL